MLWKKGFWLGPAILAVIVILILGGVLWELYHQAFKLHREKLEINLQRAADSINSQLNGNREYLLLLAEEMIRGALDENLFKERASRFVADHPGLINILWANENFIIQWTAPYEPNKQVIGLTLSLPEPERASRKAYETKQPVYTRPFTVIQGTPAFEVYVPVFHENRFLGVFSGVYSIERVLRHFIPPTLRDNYRIAFHGEPGDILLELPASAEIDDRLTGRIPLSPPGYGVSISLSRYEWQVWPRWVWVLIILCGGLAAGTSWGMIALRRDIKLRIRYEKQLKEVNKQLRAGIDNMPNAYVLVDTQYRVKEWNRKAEQIFGYTREEMIGKRPIDYIVPPEIRQTIRGTLKKHKEGKGPSYSGKDNNIRKDGTLITCLWSDTPLMDRNGNLYGILSMAQDITVQKEAEEEIRRQNEFLNNAIDSLTHPFYVIDVRDLTIKLANKAARVDRPLPNITCYALTHKRNTPCDFPGHTCPVDEIKKTKKPFTTVHTHYDKEGKSTFSEVHGYPIFDNNGNIEKVIEYSLDITERKRNEEERRKLADQLRHAQKMEAVGTLAGGVAHEFNNILGAITGYTELAADDTPPDTAAGQNLQQVLVAADRAKEMVKQILAFSRKDEMERKPVSISEIVGETLILLKSTLPATIDIRRHIEKKLKPIPANPTEIHQVIMNLCTNAAHAMKTNGGTLEITLNEIDFDTAPIDSKEPKHGKYQQLTVSDTGHGMTPKIKDRVFEPYFTTREQGEGTGMGLAVVHGIITRHGGEIIVDSEPGNGSAFHVFLPVTDHDYFPPTEEK